MNKYLTLFSAAALAIFAMPAHAAFTPDDFNGTSLGSQWTVVPSSVAADNESTFTVAGGHVSIEGPVNSDQYYFVDTPAFIEQDVPTGTNWEVVTKIDNWDPTQPGEKRRFTRTGIMLWQDNNHWIGLTMLTNDIATEIQGQNIWQTDPDNVWDGDLNDHYSNLVFLGPADIPSLPSIWMKIQCTPKGYRGFISNDGTDWFECLTITKSPDTVDGLFTNAKIRLFHAGGFLYDANDQTGTPAEFDFLHKNTLPAPPSGYQDSEFNGATLGSQWQFYPGVLEGDLGINVPSSPGKLILSAGPFASIWNDKEQGTYVFQDAPDGNFTLTTKVSPVNMDLLPYELFNAYGLWIWHDQANWAFISNQRNNDGAGANSQIECAFKHQGTFTSAVQSFGQAECPEYLRAVKIGDSVYFEYSMDNISWSPVGPTSYVGTDHLQVRLNTRRTFNDGARVDAEFDWLRKSPAAEVNDWQLY